MKKGFLIIISVFCLQFVHAQVVDSVAVLPVAGDSTSGVADTAKIGIDSAIASPKETYQKALQNVLADNKYLNASSKPESLAMLERKYESKDILFYAIFTLLLLFGLLKMFYSRYLNNLFRVFFNTSLRQSQLTDQLLQAKLPSLLFNIFFVLTGGFYLYFLLYYLGHVEEVNDFSILFLCIAALTAVYVVKYMVLKFTGWISGYKNAADTYIFIIFLINKIIAIVLIPVIIIMAFSDRYLVNAVVIASWIIIVLMLLLRFLRSYSILQNKVKVQRYHFFLYIIGIEILPLLLIYKTAMKLLTNNL